MPCPKRRKGACQEDGCDKPTHARRLCKAHYSAWYRATNPQKVERYNATRSPRHEARCPRCGKEFKARAVQIYCTDACQRKAAKVRERAIRVALECSWCGATYQGLPYSQSMDRQHRYCSPECQAEGKRWRLRKVFSCPVPWADCRVCGCRFVSRKGRTACERCWVPGKRYDANLVWFCGYCAECGEAFVTQRRGVAKFCSLACKRSVTRTNRRASDARFTRETTGPAVFATAR